MVAYQQPTVAILREVKILRSFSDQELQSLLGLGTPMQYEAHANIVIEGEPSWGLYMILSGIVGIFKTNKLTGDVYDVGQLKEGNFFGEMSLIDENPRSATVRALSGCHVFHVSKEAFNGFVEKTPGLKLRFYEACIKSLVNRLRDLDENYVISQYQLWKVAVTKEAS